VLRNLLSTEGTGFDVGVKGIVNGIEFVDHAGGIGSRSTVDIKNWFT
jgi:hypothetical protein